MTLDTILNSAMGKDIPSQIQKNAITNRLKRISMEQAFPMNELHGYKLKYNFTDFGIEVLTKAANRNGVSLYQAMRELL